MALKITHTKKVAKSRRAQKPCKPEKTFSWKGVLRGVLSEFFGTFLMNLLRNTASAQYLLSKRASGRDTYNWANGISYSLGILTSGRHKKAQLNPIVSLSLLLAKKIHGWKVILYVITQLLAAMASSFFVHMIYREAINDFDGGVRSVLGDEGTGKIFTSYPQSFLSLPFGFLEHVVTTALFVTILLASYPGDNNPGCSNNSRALFLGITITGLGFAFSYNSDSSINPALDLGSRLYILAAGWGTTAFTLGPFWFWIPIIGPLVGSFVGLVLYSFFLKKKVKKVCHKGTETACNKIINAVWEFLRL